MKKHYRKENDCLNCGATLQGRFCHNCGQENLEMKESFGHMMSHAISDYFHFDDQFFHTLKPLLFKPGKLTVEYNTGHRASYLHPVKMYIFISVIYFLVLFQTGTDNKFVKINDSDKTATKKELLRANAIMDSTINDPNTGEAAKTGLLAAKEANNDRIRKLGNADNTKKTDESDSLIFGVNITKYKTYDQFLAAQQKLPKKDRAGIFTKMFTKNMIYYHERYGAQAKEMVVENFKHMMPKMMFLILPLFALILYITFIHDKRFYVEHMIYSFHLHCFIFLFVAFEMLFGAVFSISDSIMQWVYFIAFFYIIWYIYKSLRVVYHRGKFRTITKMIGMSFSYFFVFMCCMAIALVLTILFRPMPSE
jgi:hypothetical protein